MSWFGMLMLMAFSLSASMDAGYQAGRNFAIAAQPQVQRALAEAKPSDVPGFETDHPPQADLDPSGNFEGAIAQELTQNEAAIMLKESAAKRPRFTIDPKTEPLFQHADPESAQGQLNIDPSAKQASPEGSLERTCEEGGEEVTYECTEDRHVIPQVSLKKTTLWVNHLSFTPNMESYVIREARPGNFWRHGQPEERGLRHNGYYTVTLPQNIDAFKSSFCPGFSAQDSKTQVLFKIDCSKIEAYEINGAHSLSEANGQWSAVTKEKQLNITLHHRTYDEGEEIDTWQSHCAPFEEMVEAGLCHYAERKLSQGPETRNIQGYAISKDAWQYRQIYQCQMVKDECSALRAQGCHQIGSTCKEMKGDRCWIYEQRYQCPNGDLGLATIKGPEHSVFCLTGDCHDRSYQANGDLLEAISRLSLLKEIQDDVRAQNNDTVLPIFKGEDQRCTRNCVNFKDCCGRLKGWGVSLKLTDCDEKEQALAERRAQHLCHRVGTHCTDRLLGMCLSKETSFCCFGSRFARILQEQGRSQLQLGWGSAESPECRGLNIEEISSLNLSQMNFSEVFEELMRKYRTPDMPALQERTQERIQNNLRQIERGLQRKEALPQTGRLDAEKTNL